MARHARGARPAEDEQPAGRAGRRQARAAAQQKRRRRTGGLLAICATALAAGAGGVVSGVLPAPDAAVVAGDAPLEALSPDGTGTPGSSSPGASPNGATAAGTPSPSAGVTRADASPAADRGEARSPLASPTAIAPGATAAPSSPATTAPAPKPSPTATAKPTATASPSTKAATPAAAVLALVNDQRKAAGCAPVTADARLDALATAFSDDMAARGFFDHTDPDGHSPWDRAKAAGISNLGGENIARGQATAEAVMTAWMNSPGHRANILNCQFTKLGVGVHTGSGGPWWTQDFGF